MQHLAPDAAELLDEPDTSAEPVQSSARGGTLPPPLPPPQRASYTAPREVWLRTGDVVAGRYQIERSVSRSGSALVFEVRHLELEQRFLLRTLAPELAADAEAASEFVRGTRAALKLSSEHTVRATDAGRLATGAPYVVTEAPVGCTLREALEIRGVFSPAEAVDFVLQACESIAEAHAIGLVHKNLSASTLFVARRPGGSPLIKVLDFGMPSALQGEGMDSQAPEQVRGSSDIDPRTDVWALGTVLHELITGTRVFTASSQRALLAMIVADPPVPVTALRSDVPAGLETVILRCLEKDRAARFPTVADLAAAVRDFASTEAQGTVERVTRTLAAGARSSRGPELGSLVHVGPAVPPSQPAQRALLPERQSVMGERSSWLGLGALLMVGQIVGTVVAVVLVTGWRPSEPSPAKLSVNSLVAAPEPQTVTAKSLEVLAAPAVQTAPAPVTMPAPVATPAPIAKKGKLRATPPAPAPSEEAPATLPEPVATRDRLFDSMF
jgi:serine/threonine protein kinase